MTQKHREPAAQNEREWTDIKGLQQVPPVVDSSQWVLTRASLSEIARRSARGQQGTTPG